MKDHTVLHLNTSKIFPSYTGTPLVVIPHTKNADKKACSQILGNLLVFFSTLLLNSVFIFPHPRWTIHISKVITIIPNAATQIISITFWNSPLYFK